MGKARPQIGFSRLSPTASGRTEPGSPESAGRRRHGAHEWFFSTRTFQKVHGTGGGTTGIDDDFAARGFAGIGAWILGRNMFGPIRGPWPTRRGRGGGGDDPPYHTPVFVLTHHARPAITMSGGTTFHFVTGGIREALARAREVAKDHDVRLGGGVATIRQYWRRASWTRMHLASRPSCSEPGRACSRGSTCPVGLSSLRTRRVAEGHACRAHQRCYENAVTVAGNASP